MQGIGSMSDELTNTLDNAKKSVKTDGYPIAIGEIQSMYERGEIILRPQYQRYFRWSSEQKSKLIESILIGLPLPSFFMAQDEEGKWEVVDGMQRLSTILDFMGALNQDYTSNPHYKRFSILDEGLFYLPTFESKGWGDLPSRVQLDFKRTKIQLVILLRETNQDARFELFQRLNSGGSQISGQELRNAILASDNPDMLNWLEWLSQNENFKKTTCLSEKDIETRYDMELVLRFIALLEYDSEKLSKALKRIGSLDVFLTKFLREISKKDANFEFEKYQIAFEKTFKKLFDVGGEGILKYKKGAGSGKFSISFFETVTLGMALNIDNLPADENLLLKINSVAEERDYKIASGAGKNAAFRIPKLLELGKNYFKA
jgi:uncharacterized protein with ParB-like and HNH nuclease domain